MLPPAPKWAEERVANFGLLVAEATQKLCVVKFDMKDFFPDWVPELTTDKPLGFADSPLSAFSKDWGLSSACISPANSLFSAGDA